MIFDLILIVIFVVIIAKNLHRGFAGSLTRIIFKIFTYIASTALGAAFANAMYKTLIQPALNKAITDAISNASANAANGVAQALPTWLTGLLNISGADLTELLTGPMSNASGVIAQAVNSVVQPAVVGFLTFFITIMLFILIYRLLLRWFRKPLVSLFRFPGLGILNNLFGVIIGMVEAFLLVSLLAYLIKLLLVNGGTDSSWFNESTIYNSYIFYHFYNGNVFTWITSGFMR